MFVPKACHRDCIYGCYINGNERMCAYILRTGEQRGCDPGRGCKRYTRPTKQKPKKTDDHMRRVCRWDHEKGYEMWQEGVPMAQIARELGVRVETVYERKGRCWVNGVK